MKYVTRLTLEQRQELRQLMETDSRLRTRHRAHAILLSDQGYTREELVDIFYVKADTISAWLNAWETHGSSGLSDAPRSGRPKVLSEAEEGQALDLVKKNLVNLKRCFTNWANSSERPSVVPRSNA